MSRTRPLAWSARPGLADVGLGLVGDLELNRIPSDASDSLR